MSKLKPCPYRVHGERTASLTVEGEYYYNEIFMPCMGSECACFHDDYDNPYCDRNGAYMMLARKAKGEPMSRFDQDREDLIRLIISICDYARLGYNVSTYNNCNNCKDKECQYKPDWGDSVRWNCPLWKGGD